MRMEVHTFDNELANYLLGREELRGGEGVDISPHAHLRYERTFTRRVRTFPLILHFSLEVESEEGAREAAEWLTSCCCNKNVEKVVVEYRDIPLDVQALTGAFTSGL